MRAALSLLLSCPGWQYSNCLLNVSLPPKKARLMYLLLRLINIASDISHVNVTAASIFIPRGWHYSSYSLNVLLPAKMQGWCFFLLCIIYISSEIYQDLRVRCFTPTIKSILTHPSLCEMRISVTCSRMNG